VWLGESLLVGIDEMGGSRKVGGYRVMDGYEKKTQTWRAGDGKTLKRSQILTEVRYHGCHSF